MGAQPNENKKFSKGLVREKGRHEKVGSVPTFLRRVFASRELIHLVENGLNRHKSDSLTFKMECGVVVGRVESSTRGVAANDKC